MKEVAMELGGRVGQPAWTWSSHGQLPRAHHHIHRPLRNCADPPLVPVGSLLSVLVPDGLGLIFLALPLSQAKFTGPKPSSSSLFSHIFAPHPRLVDAHALQTFEMPVPPFPLTR